MCCILRSHMIMHTPARSSCKGIGLVFNSLSKPVQEVRGASSSFKFVYQRGIGLHRRESNCSSMGSGEQLPNPHTLKACRHEVVQQTFILTHRDWSCTQASPSSYLSVRSGALIRSRLKICSTLSESSKNHHLDGTLMERVSFLTNSRWVHGLVNSLTFWVPYAMNITHLYSAEYPQHR